MYGDGDKSWDGGLVPCNHCAMSCAAAPLPLRMAQGAFRICKAAGAMTALSYSYLEGENRAQRGCLPSVC